MSKMHTEYLDSDGISYYNGVTQTLEATPNPIELIKGNEYTIKDRFFPNNSEHIYYINDPNNQISWINLNEKKPDIIRDFFTIDEIKKINPCPPCQPCPSPAPQKQNSRFPQLFSRRTGGSDKTKKYKRKNKKNKTKRRVYKTQKKRT